ncbi:cytochrome P450 [Streptomyces sp. NPDC046161]|uniref:cytochrome P450 n=1 Tax=Streptomyces sp. NPDC046161 TaxID=3155132 RepID=UPI003407F1AF
MTNPDNAVSSTASLADLLVEDLPFDASSEAFLRNPYYFYEKIRTQSGPIHRTPSGSVLVLGYHEAASVLRDERFGHGAQKAGEATNYGVPASSFLLTDPPGHTIQRHRARHPFTARHVERLRPRIAAKVDSLVAGAARAGHTDVVADIARPLASEVMAELIGVPERLRPRFERNAQLLVRGMDPPGLIDAATRRAIARARFALAQDIAGLLGPDTGHTTGLPTVLTEAGPDRTSRAEAIATCAQLIAAGYETSVGLIGNGLHALLSHPRELEQLAATGPSGQAVEKAVEELLRIDPPIQVAPRSALVSADIGGVTIEPGTIVLVMLGAANRDPMVFPDPHRLDLARRPRHLAFGLGAHFCLGAALARLEATLALTAVIRHRPQALDKVVTYSAGRIARTVGSLRVSLQGPHALQAGANLRPMGKGAP